MKSAPAARSSASTMENEKWRMESVRIPHLRSAHQKENDRLCRVF